MYHLAISFGLIGSCFVFKFKGSRLNWMTFVETNGKVENCHKNHFKSIDVHLCGIVDQRSNAETKVEILFSKPEFGHTGSMWMNSE